MGLCGQALIKIRNASSFKFAFHSETILEKMINRVIVPY
jgi:hypothetical protein